MGNLAELRMGAIGELTIRIDVEHESVIVRCAVCDVTRVYALLPDGDFPPTVAWFFDRHDHSRAVDPYPVGR